MFEPIYYKDFKVDKIIISEISKKTSSEGGIPFVAISFRYVTEKGKSPLWLGLPTFTCPTGIRKFENKEAKSNVELENKKSIMSVTLRYQSSNLEHVEFANLWLSIFERIKQLILEANEKKEYQVLLSKIVKKDRKGNYKVSSNLKDPIKLFYNQTNQKDVFDFNSLEKEKNFFVKLDKYFKAYTIYYDSNDQEKTMVIRDLRKLRNRSFTANPVIDLSWIYIGNSVISLVTTLKTLYILEIGSDTESVPDYIKQNIKKLKEESKVLNEQQLNNILNEPEDFEEVVSVKENIDLKESKEHKNKQHNNNNNNNDRKKTKVITNFNEIKDKELNDEDIEPDEQDTEENKEQSDEE